MGVLITRHELAELLYLQRLLFTRGGFRDLHAWGRAAAEG